MKKEWVLFRGPFTKKEGVTEDFVFFEPKTSSSFAASGVRTHASMIAGLKSAALNHSAIAALFFGGWGCCFHVFSKTIFEVELLSGNGSYVCCLP